MPLRKSPLRTLAALAARRANGRKSQGPKTLSGKARASLNALKRGEYAVHLRRKLLEAGDRQGEALYARIEARVLEALYSSGSIPASTGTTPTADSVTPAQTGVQVGAKVQGQREWVPASAGTTVVSEPRSASREGTTIPEKDIREVRELTSLVWSFAARRPAQRLPHPKTNLECALESIGCDVKDLSQGPIRVHDGRRRIGLVFWRQRRRMRLGDSADASFNEFWKRTGNGFRKMAAAMNQTGLRAGPAEGTDPRGAGIDETEPWGGQMGFKGSIFEYLADLAGLGEWETGLRSRIFRLRRPNIWARLQFGLDKDGVYSPTIEARGRRELKKLCLAGIPVSSWPSVLSPDIDASLIPYGFENQP